MPDQPTIVAMGGGGFSMEPDNPLLDDYVLGLTGRARPRICFLATASGDRESYIERFHAAFPDSRADASHLTFFPREVVDLRGHLMSQEIIYVGGGATSNMLAVWRLHGADAILRDAWRAGIILTGLSAGSCCWFQSYLTDTYGGMDPAHDGLGLLPGSHCPHYDGEESRRPTYHREIAAGMPAGYAADDGAALCFSGTSLTGVVSSRPDARAYRVELGDGRVVETELSTRYLG